MTNTYAFIPIGLNGKVVEADRTKIRSQCMQGKNRRAGSRRSVRSARKARQAAACQEQQWTVHQDPSTARKEYDDGDRRGLYRRGWINAQHAADLILALPPPPDTALVRLPTESCPQSQELLFHYFQFDTQLKLHVPFFNVLDFTAFESLQYRWIFEDSIFFQATLLVTSVILGLQAGLTLQLTTATRLKKTLRLLNQRLAEDDGYEKDVTILVVIVLTSVAMVFGDSFAVKAHLDGLGQIVWLRRANPIHPKLLLKLDQLGLQYALATGHTPPILNQTRPLLTSLLSQASPPNSSTSILLQIPIFQSLVPIFQDLQHLIYDINICLRSGSRLSAEEFQVKNRLIQGRLLRLPLTITASYDAPGEVLRLGMLAYLTTLSANPASLIPSNATSRFPDLAQKLRAALAATEEQSWNEIPAEFRIWLLIVIVMTCFNGEEQWLRGLWADVIRNRMLLRWGCVREVLAGIMWISVVHDDDGVAAWRRLSGRGHLMADGDLESSKISHIA